MATKKIYINGKEINAKLITDLTALTAVDVSDTTKKSILVADEDSPNDEAKRMLLSELSNLITDGAGVKTYKVLLTQTGINKPTCVISKNTLNEVPEYSYVSEGVFRLTPVNLFNINKTHVNINQSVAGIHNFAYVDTEDVPGSIVFGSFSLDTGSGVNSQINNVSFLIEVYP